MAVDEVLMEWSAAAGECCWRFYRWEEATLSLGYFQPYEDRRRHSASLACPVVRRVSGGGAIVHDAELTYSFVAPRSHPLAARRLDLYKTVHETLIEVLREWGITASLCGARGETAADRQPFLCFERRAPGDVLVGGGKIAGSAQRRSAGAVLQHGSVLLRRSAAAPELDGLEVWAGSSISAEALPQPWLRELSRHLLLSWRNDPITRSERRRVEELADRKYGSDGWTRRRGR
jgi:lipoate-protein ligase A